MKVFRFNYKVASSSIIEVIVAMLLASIVFTFSFSIIFNVTSRSSLITKSYYSLIASSSLERFKISYMHGLAEEVEKLDGLTIIKRVSDYQNFTDLKLLEIRVYSESNEEVAVCSCLKRVPVNYVDISIKNRMDFK